MRCERIWAFDEKLERRADHQSAKSRLFWFGLLRRHNPSLPLPNGITRMPPCEVRARPKRQQQLSCPRRTAEFCLESPMRR